jgi:hypothetical protein
MLLLVWRLIAFLGISGLFECLVIHQQEQDMTSTKLLLLLRLSIAAANLFQGDILWNNEFNSGSLNPNDWSYNTAAGGWGNQELLQTCTTYEGANLDVNSGFLIKIQGKMTQVLLLIKSKLRTRYPFNTAWSKPPLRSLMLKRIIGLPFGRCGKQLWFQLAFLSRG